MLTVEPLEIKTVYGRTFDLFPKPTSRQLSKKQLGVLGCRLLACVSHWNKGSLLHPPSCYILRFFFARHFHDFSNYATGIRVDIIASIVSITTDGGLKLKKKLSIGDYTHSKQSHTVQLL